MLSAWSKMRICLALLLVVMAGSAIAQDVAVVGARVYPAPDATPLDDATVLIRQGRIVAIGPRRKVVVPAGVRIIDAKGASVVAGFWNSHIHLIKPPFHDPDAQPAADLSAALRERFTRWGFTSLFDIASLPGDARALRRRIHQGEVSGPQVLTVDMPFFPEHGTPIYVRELWQQTGAPSAEVATPEEARQRAEAQIAAGADGVKLFTGAIVGGPGNVTPMPVDIARAAVEVAHAHGKPAFSHPTNQAGLEAAIDSGVDVIVHAAPEAGEWSPAFIARLQAGNVALIPTLTLFSAELLREGVPEAVVRTLVKNSQQQLQALSQAGGQILFGTDAGFHDTYDTRLEYHLMAEAGMDWRQILASLTTAPARRFGQADQRGRLQLGYAGDLVVLGSDPQSKAEAFADVRMTVREGRVLFDAASEPAIVPAPAGGH
jgi:imidazolonepropionase-like amidohydrolase